MYALKWIKTKLHTCIAMFDVSYEILLVPDYNINHKNMNFLKQTNGCKDMEIFNKTSFVNTSNEVIKPHMHQMILYYD